ncbi:hypothetical protein GPL26_22835 [Enterocloster citroniae]|uniref:Uncharacterized protein n=1 Tax=Enterocloster citroniae TaxID=358743 RepID=A0AA41K8Q2_9FIRM|nr:hypothetical protein [Enterocloster citroniae]MBT9812440.1 hypothetical protein [Enterocloster citroniae]
MCQFISSEEKAGWHCCVIILYGKYYNHRLGIESGGRDKADQRTLMHLKSLETVVELHLATLMAEGQPYKEVYQGVKRFIEAL